MPNQPPTRRRSYQFRLRTLLIVTALIAVAISLWQWHSQRKAEVGVRYTTLQQAMASKEYERAYECMSRQYRADHTMPEFVSEWDGRLLPLEPGALISVFFSSATIYPYSVEFFEFLNGEEFLLVKHDGKWYFTGESVWYLD